VVRQEEGSRRMTKRTEGEAKGCPPIGSLVLSPMLLGLEMKIEQKLLRFDVKFRTDEGDTARFAHLEARVHPELL